MESSTTKVRTICRWVHLIVGLTLLCYIYSPWHRFAAFQVFVKFIAIPIVVLSGLWLWKSNLFNKLFRLR